MKQDQILEKVRNSFIYTAKRSPKNLKSMASKTKINKKVIDNQINSYSPFESNDNNDLIDDCDTNDMYLCHVPTQSTQSRIQYKSNYTSRTIKNYDCTRSPSNADLDVIHDNDKARLHPYAWTSRIAHEIFPDAVQFRHIDRDGKSAIGSSQTSSSILQSSHAQQQQRNYNNNSNDSLSATRTSEESSNAESLEDLLFAVDSALNSMNASTVTSRKREASPNRTCSQNDSLSNAMDIVVIDISKPVVTQKKCEKVVLNEKAEDSIDSVSVHHRSAEKTNDLDSDQSNDSTFVALIHQALGPLDGFE
jgi:hypothetical protein